MLGNATLTMNKSRFAIATASPQRLTNTGRNRGAVSALALNIETPE
jgi:hypothetical protein